MELIGPHRYEIDGRDRPVNRLVVRDLLETLSYLDTVKVLRHWNDCLVSGGEINIEVPNFEFFIQSYMNKEITDEKIIKILYGNQDNDYAFNSCSFTTPLLRKRLQEAGFEDISVRDMGAVILAVAFKGEDIDY